MRPVQHPSNNKVLGAPNTWDQTADYCSGLPVTRIQVQDRIAFYSFWRPTAEEIEMLRTGALVRLCVVGDAHPVVAMEVKT